MLHPVREARELVRYARLVQLRSGLKAQVRAVMAKSQRVNRARSNTVDTTPLLHTCRSGFTP